MSQTEESIQLASKIASMEALVDKLNRKLEEQKNHHQVEKNQLRTLIELQQTANTQTKTFYERARVDLEDVKKLSVEYHRKASDRKKSILEIKKKIEDVSKQKSNTKHHKGTSVHEVRANPIIPPSTSSSLKVKATVPTSAKVEHFRFREASDNLKPLDLEQSSSRVLADNANPNPTLQRSRSKDAESGSYKESKRSPRGSIIEQIATDASQELVLGNGRTRKKSYSWSRQEIKQFIKPSDSKSKETEKSPFDPVSQTTGSFLQERASSPKKIAPPGLQAVTVFRKTSSFDESSPILAKLPLFSSTTTPPSNGLPKSASQPLKPSEKVSGLKPTISSPSLPTNNELQPVTSTAHLRRLSFGASETPESGQRIKLRITCGALMVTTIAYSDWTIGTLSDKVLKKFPSTARGYALFIKVSNSKLKLMDTEKKVNDYKQLLDPTPPELFFQERPAKKAGIISRLFRPSTRANLEQLHEAIKKEDISSMDRLLQSFSTSELEELNQWGQTPLHAAINSNNVAIVDLFLNYYKKTNMDINIPDNFGWTVLHFAVSSTTGNASDDEILSLLLNFPGIEVDVSNNDSNTPLHYFCQRFSSPSCQSLGELLISKAPATVNRKNKNGETPLHKAIFNPAIRVLMVKLLVNNGADVNIPSSKAGETALHYAVRLGRKDLIKILLCAGADMNARDTVKKFTPCDLASATDQDDVKNTLQAVADLKSWLTDLGISNHFYSFLTEEMFLDVLVLTDEATLAELLGRFHIDDEEIRRKIGNACKNLKERMSKKEFEARLLLATKKKRLSVGPDIEEGRMGQFKETLHQLVQDAGEHGEARWLISHEYLEFTKELGSGRSGSVYKGLFKGKTTAIKVMGAHAAEGTLYEFKKEFHVMSSVRSPFIVDFYGACLEPRLCIVMEFCSRGSLYSVLNEPNIEINWQRALQFSKDMIAGLKFLHTFDPPIFHRDMKSLNLLVTEDWVVKICDFGLARFNTGNAAQLESLTKLCGTFTYASPELYSGLPYTEKCDVFSTGIVLWELVVRVIKGKITEFFAYWKMDYQILFNVAKKDLRPTIPPSCPSSIAKIITQCVDAVGPKRPNTTELFNMLLAVEKSIFSSDNNSK